MGFCEGWWKVGGAFVCQKKNWANGIVTVIAHVYIMLYVIVLNVKVSRSSDNFYNESCRLSQVVFEILVLSSWNLKHLYF